MRLGHRNDRDATCSQTNTMQSVLRILQTFASVPIDRTRSIEPDASVWPDRWIPAAWEPARGS